jgi:hypothetical protein
MDRFKCWRLPIIAVNRAIGRHGFKKLHFEFELANQSKSFAKCLAHVGPWGVVVALAVELACAGQLMPGLEMLTNGLVQQRSLGVTWVVEFGFAR